MLLAILAALAPIPAARAAALPSWTIGPKRVLAIRVEFPDLLGETITSTEALNVLNGPVAGFFAANSYGQTTLTTTVSRLYLMPRTAVFYATDTTGAYEQDAEKAASADHDVAAFNRVVLINNHSLASIPGSIFTFGALGAVDGERLWINGSPSFTAAALIHELGHTFGLMHANLWSVADGDPISAGGRNVEYGDPTDIMGTGTDLRSHFNPAAKANLGWLPEATITPVFQSGTYRIYRFDDGGASLQRPLALTTLRQGSQWYWVGYRAGFSENRSLANGAYVVWGRTGTSPATQLLDLTTPGNNTEDAALGVGQRFTDSSAGISFRPTARGGIGMNQYLDIEVTLDPRNGIVTAWGDLFVSSAEIPQTLANVQSIAGGYDHGLALQQDRTVVGWGSNEFGETTIPADLSNVVKVSAGYQTSAAIKRDGTVVMWGDNRAGQASVPAGLTGVHQLGIGWQFAVALKQDGTTVSWGTRRVELPQNSSIVAIAVGYFTAIGLAADGTVVQAQQASPRPEPTDIPFPPEMTDVVAIAAGHQHFLALRANGRVVAWGSNLSGEATVPAGLSGVSAVAAGQQNSFALKDDGTVVAWGWNSTRRTRVPPGLNGVEQVALAGAPLALLSTGPLRLRQSPADQTVAAGQSADFWAKVTGSGPWRHTWQRNGADLAGETRTLLRITNVSPADAGLYTATSSNASNSVTTNPAILGVSSRSKIVGAGVEVGRDVVHPNGNTFDQILLTGVAESITADPRQITRTSFIDLSNDIVQVEFSGAGTLSLVLDAPSRTAATPVNYHQPTISYMKGHAGIVVTGANETTHLSVFSVGRATAFDPTGAFDITKTVSSANDPAKNGSPLFSGHSATHYDGMADIAFIAIQSENGKFGGLRTANVNYFASRGITGIFAPNVVFAGPVYLGDITAFDSATPMIRLGSAADVRITGGDLAQDNAVAVQVSGMTQLKFTAGSDSHGNPAPAQRNRAKLIEAGADVTSQLVQNP